MFNVYRQCTHVMIFMMLLVVTVTAILDLLAVILAPYRHLCPDGEHQQYSEHLRSKFSDNHYTVLILDRSRKSFKIIIRVYK